jgi:LysM repeat protein
MTRSRRRASRGLIWLLVLAASICLICVALKTYHGKLAAKPLAAPVLDLSVPAPLPLAVLKPAAPLPAPIETTTPDSLYAAALPASATINPTTLPAVAQTTQVSPSPVTWSQLLTAGSTHDSTTGSLAPKPLSTTTGKNPLVDGKTLMESGQLIEARSLLNDALASGRLSDADAAAAKSSIQEINQTVIFSPKPFNNDPFGGRYAVRPGDSLAKIAASHETTWELLSQINHLDPRRLRSGSTIKVIHGPFFAVVHKKLFTMDLYLGALPGESQSMYVMSVPVGLGKDDSTPTGLWAIGPHAKLKHPTYYPPEGGEPIDADDPANPLGGYWIALTGVEGDAVGRGSYGIHGTIDPASIGHQSSLGCIRLRNDDISLVFKLLVEGKSMVRVES